MTLKLESPRSRVILILATVAIGLFLIRISLSHFVVRVIADQRVAMDRAALAAAASRYPDSPRIQYKRAEAETHGGDAGQALEAATRAVELSPWDYQARRLLAFTQELTGRQQEAEKSIRETLNLAPNNGELNWSVANILLRSGKLSESLPHFRIATVSNPELLPQALDLIWQGSNEDIETVRRLAEGEPELQLSVVRFLVEQKRIPEAVAYFNTIDRKTRLESNRSPEFLRSLMAAGQLALARDVWRNLAAALTETDAARIGPIWNPSFELGALPLFDQFDWAIRPNEYARIGFDRAETHSGLRSLRMLFSGKDTTLINGQVRQLVVLRPGARYRLECYAKATDLVTPHGPRLAIANDREVLATSDPVPEGTTPWQRLVVDFVSPADAGPRYVTIVRIPKFSYDEPTRGIVWFDDFALTESPEK